MVPVILGIGALGFNLPALIAQLINFTLLLIVFRLFLYKPLMKVLDERRRRIEEGLQASDEAKKRLAETETEVSAEMQRARQESQALIAQAQQTSARMAEEARGVARTEAEGIIERARAEIQLERDAAIQEIRRQFGDLAVTAAERVIRRNLDRAAQHDLIEQVLQEAPVAGDGSARN